MCYRGGRDHWIEISPSCSLDELLTRFAPQLGKESFFDLM